ncbi:exonuclease domain-containing protein [Niallia endozanthoxylica]|uniref:3'-5' exonuclease n=1 Tax=Niallia endozanthoxylica TaxID=2036016 RepID=A0A5J5HNY4_9BACI|nr:exonuclease domain-containing protein [Niallia endozanthoxylica]KAA9021703.1 3'-5' exonuclease [Niallia endozanthoxylica]
MAFEPFFHFMRGIKGRMQGTGLGSAYGGQDLQQIAYVRNLQKEMKQSDALYEPLNQLKVVIFDIETTGFFPEQGDEIISIGAVKMVGATICEDTFYSLIRCEKELSEKIEQLTGLNSEQLKEAPALADVMAQFYHFAKDSTLVAHHAKHEKSFLQSVNWKLFRTPFKYRIVDTSFLYRIAEPECRFNRLEELCEYNRIPVVDRHHALGDAKLAAELWRIYIQKVQDSGCNTLQDVYHRMAKQS